MDLNPKTNLKRNLLNKVTKKFSNPVAVEVKITVPFTAADLSETKRKLQQTFNYKKELQTYSDT